MAFLDEKDMKFDDEKEMSSATSKTFRYGTAIMPTLVKGIISKLPPHLKIIDPRKFDEEALMDFAANLSTSRRRGENLEIKGKGRYPSVSALLGASEEDQTKLYEWQEKQIKELGFPGLLQYMGQRTKSGTNFHKTVEFLLAELQKTGSISDESCEKALKEKALNENYGYIEGIIPFLKTIPKTDWMTLEKKTTNHYYCYQGRFDAIVQIDGEPTLVDWKTVSAGAYKHHGVNDLKRLYGVPLQVVAYIAAVNSDPAFSSMPKIRQGAVVLSYEDGRPAEPVMIKHDDLKHYEKIFGEKLNHFWWKIMHPRKCDITSQGIIDFVFNRNLPLTPLVPKEDKKPDVVVLEDEIITEATSQNEKEEVKEVGALSATKTRYYAMFESKKKTTTAAADSKDIKQSNKTAFGI